MKLNFQLSAGVADYGVIKGERRLVRVLVESYNHVGQIICDVFA
jgi:hypothetical protein